MLIKKTIQPKMMTSETIIKSGPLSLIFHKLQLNVILKKRIPCIVALDPRTLLKSKKDIQITLIDDGRYWHNGLIESLETILQNLNDKPKCVSLNVNIDGLPLFNSSKLQMWPILCNIHKRPNVLPFVVGQCKIKPSNVSAYFHVK